MSAKNKNIGIFFIVVLIISISLPLCTEQKRINIEVNPNIELLSVVLSMTTWMNDREQEDYLYGEEIKLYFSKFKNHRAVTIAQELTDNYFIYDAPPALMLHLGPPPDLKIMIPYGEYLETRAGGKEILNEFVSALRDFAKETDFMSFYNEHKKFYESIIKKTERNLDDREIVKNLEDFFGEKQKEYTVILAPYLFPGNYSVRIPMEEGSHCYAVLGIFKVMNKKPVFPSEDLLLYLCYHEFAHSFVNPITDKHIKEVEKLEYLYTPVAERINNMRWPELFNETVVSAFATLQCYHEYGKDVALGQLQYAKKVGAYFIDDVFCFLMEYENNRDIYPTYESYLSTLLDKLKNVRYSPEKANTVNINCGSHS